MQRVLVIIGAGAEQVPAYTLAKAKGLFVVGTDINPHAPALEYADAFVLASTRDPEATLNALNQWTEQTQRPINGVMTLASDVPLTVATVAQAFGLPGLSLTSAQLACDKLAMKHAFKAHNVACPNFWAIRTLAELTKLVTAYPQQRFVIKPIDGRGARGVLAVDTRSDLAWSFAEAQRWGDCGDVMVEAFIPGLQLSTESFILDGRIYTPAISERNYDRLDEFAPYFIEDGGTIPALLSATQLQQIDTLLLQAAQAMGITQGSVKGDLVIAPDDTPMVIELAARLPGGWFATHQIPEASGVNLVDAVMRWSLGETLTAQDLTATQNRATAIRYWFPPAGVITAINGEATLQQTPGLMAYGFFRGIGDTQPPVLSHPDRFGYVMVSADTRDETLSRVQAALKTITIDTQ